MIKRLSIIKESDTKSYRILPEILISGPGGHLTQKLLWKLTSLFVTKRTQPNNLLCKFLCAHREVAEEERGSDCPGARLQDFWQVW